MTSSPVKCPFSRPRKITLRFKVQSQSSILCGFGWTFELKFVCFTALCLHSLLLRVQMQTKHFPPPCLRVPVKHIERCPSLWAARPWASTRTGHLFFPVFTLPYLVKEWRKYCGLDAHACQGERGVNSSKRGGTSRFLSTVVLFFQ